AGVHVRGRLRFVVVEAWIGDDADAAFGVARRLAGRRRGLDAILDLSRRLGVRCCPCCERPHEQQRGRDDRGADHGVSHTGACGGLTTRILVSLSFFNSAISASVNLKSKTSRLALRWSGLSERGMAQTPICTR